MPDPLRAGIIGRGFMGQVHAHAVRVAGGRLTTIAATSFSSAKQGAVELGAMRPASSPEDLIASPDVDVVHICTPNDSHSSLAAAALDAGKHVICEKPLATGLPDAESLLARAVTSGLVTAVPFVYRSYAPVREARARIASGEAGRVHSLHGHYLQDWMADPTRTNWRVDAGTGGPSRAFADIGVHWCDLVEFVTGQQIVRLVANTGTIWPTRGPAGDERPVTTEDLVSLLFETDQGAQGTLTVSQASLGRKNQLAFSIDGTKASYQFDQESPDRLTVGSEAMTSVLARGPSFRAAAQRYVNLPPGHPQGYQDAFNAFVADVYESIGGQPVEGLPTFDAGVRAARLSAAVLESSAQRRWVEVPG
ncbi:Oxidoreductase domain protein [metagenome]|uniref:Oxidoreductase domain protein n=1 Tax=metagenome TaxID=256318 RepID=A0A2P2C413_9ZZZZ